MPFDKETRMLIKTLEDQYVKVNQINTRYWTLGSQGTTVILLHGLGGYIELWADNIDTIAKCHKVYAIDMVGFGHTDKPVDLYSLSFLAEFVKDFMDALDIQSCSLIGCSLGGGVALQFALMFQEKLEKLVLVSSIGLGKKVAPIFQLLALPFIGELLMHFTRTRIGLLLLFRVMLYETKHITHELIEKAYEMSNISGILKSFLTTLRTNRKYFLSKNSNPVVNNFTTITTETLVIWGQQDHIVPVSNAYVANSLPNVNLYIFSDCGHWSAREDPEKFNALVLNFLSSD